MPRYVAQPGMTSAWEIAAIDADGIGRRHLYIGWDREAGPQAAEDAARVLVLALSLPGGLDAAVALLRAAAVRQS